MSGSLCLIPTPIDDQSSLELKAKEYLEHASRDSNSLILVEELKACRRRWLSWGLPREAIDNFIAYNEHTRDELGPVVINELKKGKKVYLLSDCGLPAFCDPGQHLVNECHSLGFKVTSSPFPNSISLAIALSGFPHDTFVFQGFLPRDNEQRIARIRSINKDKRLQVLMDTPYRLSKILAELLEILDLPRDIFLALNLNQEEEQLYRGSLEQAVKQFSDKKAEFILILRAR